MSGLVKYYTNSKIAHIVLNKPNKLNSLCRDMVTCLVEALKTANNDPEVKVIILSAEGKSFCAGGDLEEMNELSHPNEIVDWMKHASTLTKTMTEIDKYIISAVQGYSAGAGFSIVLASDFVIAENSSKFTSSFTKVGLIPDLGLMKLLSERVPLALAKEWISFGRVITAEEAMSRGIINRVVADNVVKHSIEFSGYLVMGPPISNKFVKYYLNNANFFTQETAIMQENLIQSILLQTEDHKEGLAAFFEKRIPVFKGK